MRLSSRWKSTFSFDDELAIAFFVGLLLTIASAPAQSGSPQEQSTPTPTPTATPVVFSPQTLADLKRLQQAALSSDYAYRQVAHLADNIGPRLTGSVQEIGRASCRERVEESG